MKKVTSNKRAFTLIELLVVVLIIGILAAVAVPQYQKAVRRARIAEARVLLKSLIDATDMFYLENPGYVGGPGSESLNIDVPADTKNWTIGIDECTSGQSGKIGCTACAEPKWESGYRIWYTSPNYDGGPEEDDYAGKFTCEGNSICKGVGSRLFYEDEENQIILDISHQIIMQVFYIYGIIFFLDESTTYSMV